MSPVRAFGLSVSSCNIPFLHSFLWHPPPPPPVPSLPRPLTPLAHLALEYHAAFRGVDGVTDQGS